jgi:ferric-dicitrate binding protein FerR (iron transport regulator)
MKSTDNNARSFNRFLGVLILVVVVTGSITLLDTWSGDVTESTGPDETRQIGLPGGIRVILEPMSTIRFAKGATHKMVLEGSALCSIGEDEPSRFTTVETSDLIIRTKSARFHVQAESQFTEIKIGKGAVKVSRKSGEEDIELKEGEDFTTGGGY